MTQCPKCQVATRRWSPLAGEAGAVKAEPCGHKLTLKEARLAFPAVTAKVAEDLGRKL